MPTKLDKEKNKEVVKAQEPSTSQPTETEPQVRSYIPKDPFPQRLVGPKKGP